MLICACAAHLYRGCRDALIYFMIGYIDPTVWAAVGMEEEQGSSNKRRRSDDDDDYEQRRHPPRGPTDVDLRMMAMAFAEQYGSEDWRVASVGCPSGAASASGAGRPLSSGVRVDSGDPDPSDRRTAPVSTSVRRHGCRGGPGVTTHARAALPLSVSAPPRPSGRPGTVTTAVTARTPDRQTDGVISRVGDWDADGSTAVGMAPADAGHDSSPLPLDEAETDAETPPSQLLSLSQVMATAMME